MARKRPNRPPAVEPGPASDVAIVIGQRPVPAPEVQPFSVALAVIGVILAAAAACGCAVYETMLVPLRIGTTLAPFTLPLCVITNVGVMFLARNAARSAGAAVVPGLVWIVTCILLFSGRTEGDVLVPGGNTGVTYVGYALLLLGIITMAGTIVWLSAHPLVTDDD